MDIRLFLIICVVAAVIGYFVSVGLAALIIVIAGIILLLGLR